MRHKKSSNAPGERVLRWISEQTNTPKEEVVEILRELLQADALEAVGSDEFFGKVDGSKIDSVILHLAAYLGVR